MIRWLKRKLQKWLCPSPPTPTPARADLSPEHMAILADWHDKLTRRALREDPSGSTVLTAIALDIVRMIVVTRD